MHDPTRTDPVPPLARDPRQLGLPAQLELYQPDDLRVTGTVVVVAAVYLVVIGGIALSLAALLVMG